MRHEQAACFSVRHRAAVRQALQRSGGHGPHVSRGRHHPQGGGCVHAVCGRVCVNPDKRPTSLCAALGGLLVPGQQRALRRRAGQLHVGLQQPRQPPWLRPCPAADGRHAEDAIDVDLQRQRPGNRQRPRRGQRPPRAPRHPQHAAHAAETSAPCASCGEQQGASSAADGGQPGPQRRRAILHDPTNKGVHISYKTKFLVRRTPSPAAHVSRVRLGVHVARMWLLLLLLFHPLLLLPRRLHRTMMRDMGPLPRLLLLWLLLLWLLLLPCCCHGCCGWSGCCCCPG
jgi:hypothetical protein